ncbi:hypothetical protein [Paraburkholderia sediminicola]|uniref:hypothetical protein n=1 Tax=Paraburkholderia sediminicola TaxID=458836 RepID=UPI0038BCEE9A
MPNATPIQASILAFPRHLASSNRSHSTSATVASIADLRKETAGSGMRAAMLDMMLDAAILATLKPTEGADIAFDEASANAIVSAIEGVRRVVISAPSVGAIKHG